MIAQPTPPPTLFPYTTLFRSQASGNTLILIGVTTQAVMNHLLQHHIIPTEITAQKSDLGGEDRKSTRLNSSHMSISYAVFCLKKKNRKHFHRSAIAMRIHYFK